MDAVHQNSLLLMTGYYLNVKAGVANPLLVTGN
jgi:hypothetical protein